MAFDPDHVEPLWRLIEQLDGDLDALERVCESLNQGKIGRHRWDWEIAVSELMEERFREHLPADLQDDQGPLQDHARWVVGQGEALVRAVLADPSSIPKVSTSSGVADLGGALDDLFDRRFGGRIPWVPASWRGTTAPK